MVSNNINITEKYVAFWGSIFSNFNPCYFKNNDGEWYNSEQYFMWQKAKYFGDEETANLIYNEKDPAKCKKLGRKVQNFDVDKWDKYSITAMEKAVYDKFNQNEDLKKELLSSKYEGKNFVEGSPYDTIWGVGIIYDSILIEDEDNWKGQNLLGKTLDKVRTLLKK